MKVMLRILIVALGCALPAQAAPPPNDAFIQPATIAGFPAFATGTNVDATLEVGEPDPDNYQGEVQASVWYQWTAPVTTNVQVNTLGSDFDTVLAVWTGSALNALGMLADNDQFYGTDQSAVTIPVVQGLTYRIAVYGWFSSRGSIRLNITNNLSGRISGRITGPDGTTPLYDIQVRAYAYNGYGWESSATTYTDGDGAYTLDGLTPDTYRLRFRDSAGDYLTEYYSDADEVETADDIVVPVLGVVTGINASLAQASGIAGMVTGPDGTTPLEEIDVTAYTWDGGGWNSFRSDITGPDGFYRVGGLTAGTYRIEFQDPNGNYQREFYTNAVTVETALDIVVPVTTTVNGINAALDLASHITGTVTGPDGTTPLNDIYVTAHRYDGLGWSWVGGTETQPDGTYDLGGLPPDTYRVEFYDWQGQYVRQAFSNVLYVWDGQDIVVGPASTVSGINAALALAARITGTVTGPDGLTPLSGISVTAFGWSGFGWDNSWTVQTRFDGTYTIGGLTGGTYRISFEDNNGFYANEFYDNKADVLSADDVTVNAGATAVGIDAQMGAGDSISGTVTGPDALTPLAGISVAVYQPTGFGWEYVKADLTDGSGAYTLGGLAPATYRVGFSDPSGQHVTEFYNDKALLLGADDVVITAGGSVSGLNASLAAAARIQGLVTRLDGITPITNFVVNTYRWDGANWVYISYTYGNPDGTYSVGGLPGGTYRLYFIPAGFMGRYYTNNLTINEATDIVVVSGGLATGINMALQAYARISGQALRQDGVTPVDNIAVDAYRQDGLGWTWSGWGTTDNSGYFDLSLADAGTYRLTFTDYQGVYAYEVYQDAPDLNSGADIPLASEGQVSGLQIRMGHEVDWNQSQPEVERLLRKPGNVWEVQFQSVSGLIYRMRAAGHPTGVWQDVTVPFISQGGTNVLSVTGTAVRGFFSLQADP